MGIGVYKNAALAVSTAADGEGNDYRGGGGVKPE